MQILTKHLLRFYSKFSHFYYWNSSIIKSKLYGNPDKTILLPHVDMPGWEENLDRGFRNTKNKFEFKDLSVNTIAKYDCVIPISIDDLLFANKNRELISDNPMPIPSEESIRVCDDKFVFNTKMTQSGFGDFIPNMGITGDFPYILKKKIDISGENSFIIDNKENEHEKIELINNKADYFTQKLIPGKQEFATHVLIKNKRIIKSLNIQYAFDTEYAIKGKDKHLHTTIGRCPHLEIFRAILNSINFEGMCCVNYKEVNGKPMIIEINPRVGYSLSKYLFSFVDTIL